MSESVETFNQKLWRFSNKIAAVLDWSEELGRISDILLGAPEEMANYLAAQKRLAEIETAIHEKCTTKFFLNNPVRENEVLQPHSQVNDWEELLVAWNDIYAACDTPEQFTKRYLEFLAEFV